MGRVRRKHSRGSSSKLCVHCGRGNTRRVRWRSRCSRLSGLLALEQVPSNVTHRQAFTMIRPRHVVCGVATLLLHAIFFSSVILGSSAAKRSPEEFGPGSTEIVASDGSWMTLVVVHMPEPDGATMSERVASRGEVRANPVIQVVSPDPTPLASLDPPSLDDASDAVFSAGDPAMQSLLFGVTRSRSMPAFSVRGASPQTDSCHETRSHGERVGSSGRAVSMPRAHRAGPEVRSWKSSCSTATAVPRGNCPWCVPFSARHRSPCHRIHPCSRAR